jgi:hypothetical protein
MFPRFQTLSGAEACLLDSGRNVANRKHVRHMWRCRHVVSGESADEKVHTTFKQTQFLGNKFDYASALLNGASWKFKNENN